MCLVSHAGAQVYREAGKSSSPQPSQHVVLQVLESEAQTLGIFLRHALPHELLLKGPPCTVHASTQGHVHPAEAQTETYQIWSRFDQCNGDFRSFTHISGSLAEKKASKQRVIPLLACLLARVACCLSFHEHGAQSRRRRFG